MKRFTFVLVVLLAWAPMLLGVVWNAAWEALPAGTDLASDLDPFIQEFKEELANRTAVESIFGIGSDDNGLMRVGSARCFIQNAAPTDIAGVGQYNSTAGAFVGTALTTEEIGASTDDIGRGRCWVDLDGPDGVAGTPDDRSLATWDETNNRWVYAGAANPTGTLADQRFLFDPGKFNLVYNGSFELTDGDGDPAGTGTPTGWANVAGPATYTYTASDASNGDGVHVDVTGVGAASGISQVLTNLKASTTYYAVARVDSDGVDTCRMNTTGAATDLANQDTTSAAFTTLSGTFVTAAALDTVTLQLLSVGAGDICHWDLVAVYETSSSRRGIGQPGSTIYTVLDTTTSATDCNGLFEVTILCSDLMRITVDPPGPGYLVMLTGWLSVDPDGDVRDCVARIAKADTTRLGINSLSGPGGAADDPLQVTAMDGPLTPGAATVYEMDLRSSGGTTCDLNCTAGDNCSLQAMLIPTR